MRGGLEFWSNIFYLAAGVLMIVKGRLLTGIALIFLAVTSGWFHLSGSRPARLADRYGMLAVMMAMACEAGAFPWWLSAAVMLAGPLIVRHPIDLVVTVMYGFLVGYRWPNSVPAALLFLLAVVFAWLAEPFQYDANRALAYDILHGLWHLLTASAISAYMLA